MGFKEGLKSGIDTVEKYAYLTAIGSFGLDALSILDLTGLTSTAITLGLSATISKLFLNDKPKLSNA